MLVQHNIEHTDTYHDHSNNKKVFPPSVHLMILVSYNPMHYPKSINSPPHYPNGKFLPCLGSFCLLVLSGNYYWNFLNGNVDEAILDFSFGKNQMKVCFWLLVRDVFMLTPLKAKTWVSHWKKNKTMWWETFKLFIFIYNYLFYFFCTK